MHRILIKLVCLAMAATAVRADDARDRLNVQLRDLLHDGEWAINRGRLQDAKDRLTKGDAALQKQDPAYGAWRSRTLLARVYLESEQFDKAAAEANAVVRLLADLPQPDQQQIRRDRQTIALVQADVAAALRERALALRRADEARQHAVAETRHVRACLAIPEGLRLVDLAWEIKVLRRLAELEQSQNHPREAADAWDLLMRRATVLRDRFAPRVAPGPNYEPAEPYLVAVRSLAVAHHAQNRLPDAVAQITPLLKFSLEDSIRVRILAEVANMYGQSRDYPHQREFLLQAVAVESRRKEPDAAHLAQFHAQIALAFDSEEQARRAQAPQALPPEKELPKSQEHWTAAAKFFEQARLPKKADKDDPERAKADEMLYLQQLQAIYQHQERYDDAQRVAGELHDRRVARYLPDDPRIFRSKASLGSYLVKNMAKDRASAAAAATLLDAAANYFSTRNPPEPDIQVRAWIARAEVHRAEGVIRAASDLLDRAEAQCAAHAGLVSEKVRMSLCLNRGLVLAEQGMYQRAVESYQQALGIGDKLGATAGELRASALVNLAMVYKSQLQFREARDFCGQALADRLRVLPSTSRDMLPYYVAAAGLDIAERNAESLEQSVHKAWEVCVTHHIERLAHPDVAAVWHQRAMIDYLKNEQSPNAGRRQAAREAFQQALVLEEQLAAPDGRARTLHYLAKLKFADFVEALAAWKARDAKGDPEYSLYFRDFLGHRAEFEKRSAQYVKSVEEYEKQLDVYERDADNQTATPAEYDTLTRKREALEQQRDQLKADHTKLAADEESAQQRYLEAKKTQRDGIVARLDAELREGETLANQSVELLDRSGVFPNLHYAALCNHGQIMWSLSEWNRADAARSKQFEDQAIGQLRRAVQLTETPRSMTTGGDIARAEFFSNYATAFDLLVQWNTQKSPPAPAEALRYAEMGRNRTFLDQIRASEVDLRDTLPAAARPLLDREQELLKRHGEKMARARTLARKPAAELSPQNRDELLGAKADLESLREQYVALREKIYAASPQYNGLARAEIKPDDVPRALAQVSSPRHPLLYYYVGAASSHLFLVAGDAQAIDHYALAIPQGPGAEVLSGSRRVPAAMLTELVNRYRKVISDETTSKSLLRGPWKTADALVVTGKARLSYTALTDMLLPPPVRDKIRSLKADYVTIVPDGPLHHLPFEALPLSEESNQKKFLFDEFPALAYAPSVMILQALSQPRDTALASSRAALTLGNPQFGPRAKPAPSEVTLAVANVPVDKRFVDRAGDLPPLQYAERESRDVQVAFNKAIGASNVVALVGPDATEGRLRQEIDRRHFAYIHLATHGLVDEGVFNLFGAIMLTPPKEGGQVSHLDDGELQLHEIPGLKLSGCELAVLSACQTNIGPARPMETGSTFARAFLSAGVRRVVSSQWSIADESTAMLVKPLFESVVGSLDRPGARLNYAQALRAARSGIRNSPQWSAPCYWAPFVLVGPAE